MTERPCNLEAEEALIGSALISPDVVLPLLVTEIVPDDFYWHAHGWAWGAMQNLVRDGKQVDFITVSDELMRMGKLEEYASAFGGARGSMAIADLIAKTPTSMHAETYAATVRDYAAKRKILDLMNKGAGWAMNGASAAKIIKNLDEGISGIALYANANSSGVSTPNDVVSRAMTQVEDANAGKLICIPTGLIDVDNILNGGMYADDLLLVAARPGEGKTALLISFLVNAAVKKGKKCYLFSMEMPNEQIVLRMIAQLSGIPLSRLRTGKLEDADWPPYIHFSEVIAQAPIYFDDAPRLSANDMRQRLRRVEDSGIDLVLLDQLNMMALPAGVTKRHEQLDLLSYDVKTLAREFHVPVVAAHQLNRNIEGRPHDSSPQLSDLENAGEKAADVVMFIVNEKQGKTIKSSKIEVAKHRNGGLGAAQVTYLANLTRFDNYTPERK